MHSYTLVDTDILIDAGRSIGTALTYLENLAQHTALAVSVVTHMELLVGCRNQTEQHEEEKFLQHFTLLPLNEAISEQAVVLLRQYRLSHNLLIADALIAATAMHYDYQLASKNQRDYRFIAGLNLLPYS